MATNISERGCKLNGIMLRPTNLKLMGINEDLHFVYSRLSLTLIMPGSNKFAPEVSANVNLTPHLAHGYDGSLHARAVTRKEGGGSFDEIGKPFVTPPVGRPAEGQRLALDDQSRSAAPGGG
jgi:hypothetical protein